ncbi:restriction endonuclease subunit S [Enterococcus gallinarum]|uniref:Restriction endonuclease subunit S n=2 Tax=Enterococcus gallinarum TaxID=1353 RepID=A0ABD4ZNS1_ENTGA|nr:restriction endonuclease subunit S [Enterococcus gallinarum]MDL4873674.1 restriction endonuclease subunit S [Enterococcus gallinarum]MDL4880165.1 restriction endonuclease subunit S [Enterococcus gallinarum]MDL4883714.1 restriction endonuclease subunit S [Enterococcus gallinarum]MDL4892442.1 restriction endonuclease subunit S [Enterococcus gallinarum]MDL4919202.1 restriction endonuclease subunit S [Enterococcus gallinarum]
MNKNKPEIRFPGFTEEWEQRKLGDEVHDVGTGRSSFISGIEKSSDNPYAVLGSTSVISYDREFDYSGDFILTARVGANAGTLYKYSGDAKISDNTVYIQSLNLDFVYYILTNFDLKRLSFGTGQPLVKASELKNLKIMFPRDGDEQQKIGTFFKQLDDTIALHQRELELLKETKKGFLQKMFPKEGEKVPEIRFPGFTEEWEQRKVFEISKVTYGGGTPKTNTKEFWNGNIPWIQSSDLEINRLFNVSPKKKITNEAVKKSAAKIIPPNSIAIVTRVGVGKLALMPFEYATSQDFLSLSELQIDSYFGIFSLYSMLQKELKNIQGTSIKGMTKSDLLEKKVTIPKKYEEQQKIGNFFKQLDDTITLHQRELDLLKETKKGFLQKLFV